MKNNMPLYYAGIVLTGLLVLSGCISVSSSPNSRFFMLQAMDKDQVSNKFSIPADIIIGIGPVKIPDYLDRPQMVTRNKNNTLSFAQFDRWGESLDFGLERLVNKNLSLMFPGVPFEMFPWNLILTVKYQVIMDVVQLDSRLDQDLNLVVQWSIIDLEEKKMVFTKRSELRQPVTPHSYAGYVDALSVASASLSTEIAQALSTVANQAKKKKDNSE